MAETRRFEVVTTSGRTLCVYDESKSGVAKRVREMGLKVHGKIVERSLNESAVSVVGDVYARPQGNKHE